MYSNNEKRYILEQMINVGDFSLFVPEVINEAIMTYYEPELKGRSVTNVFQATSPIISWLDERGLDAAILGEGEEPPRNRLRYSKRTLRMLKIGAALEFSNEVIEDTALDLVARHIARTTQAIARKENQYIFSVLAGGVADGSVPFKTGEKYASHIIEADISSQWTPDNADITHEKIQVCLQVLEDEGFNPDTVMMHPSQYTQIQKLQQFQDATTGAWSQIMTPLGERMLEGERAPYGLSRYNVVVDASIPNDEIIFMQKGEYSAFYELRPLGINEIPDNLRDMRTFTMFERVGCAVIRPAAAVKLDGLTVTDPTTFQT